MTNKNKGSHKAAQKIHTQHHTPNNLHCTWHSQAESVKPSRLKRRAKRTWARGLR